MGMHLWGKTDRLLAAGLDVSARRAQVLSHNIANVNTPGYKRKDIDFRRVLQQVNEEIERGEKGAMEARTPGSIAHQAAVRNDGNSVDVEREMAYLAENSLRYNSMVEILNRRIRLLRAAISEGRR